MYGSFNGLDLQCPRPQAPPRRKIDIAEGPGAMNMASSSTTCRSQKVALCGEVVAVDSWTAGASRPFRDLKRLTAIPVPAGVHTTNDISTAWVNTAAKGTSVYARTFNYNNVNDVAEIFSNGFRLVRGSVVFTLTVYASTLHKGRLKMAFAPYPRNTTPTSFTEQQANNLFYTVLDLGLNSTVSLTVPFSSDTWLRESNMVFGRMHVFVNSRLSVTTATSSQVQFVVYSNYGDDCEWYTPINRGVVYQGDEYDREFPMSSWGSEMDLKDLSDGSVSGNDNASAAAAGLGAPENATKSTSGAGPTALNTKVVDVNVMRSCHTKTNFLFGRAMYLGDFTLVVGTVAFSLPTPATGHMGFLKLFHFFSGDLNLHIQNRSTSPVYVAHSYVTDTTLSLAKLTALGSVVIPAGAMMSIRVPWYNLAPVRRTDWTDALGYLYAFSEDTAKLSVSVSFTTLNLYYPVGVPKKATVRSFMKYCKDMVMEPSYYMSLWSNTVLKKYDDPIVDGHDEYTSPETIVSRLNKQGPGRFLRKFTRKSLPKVQVEVWPSGEDWIPDLTIEGIEPNPGPGRKMSLVFLNRGLYRHYGISDGQNVIHMSSDNILAAAASGRVPIVSTPLTPEWCVEDSVEISELQASCIEKSVGSEHLFSASWNCETFAKACLGIDSIDQARSLAVYGVMLASITGCFAIGLNKQGLLDFIKSKESSAKESLIGFSSNVTDFLKDQLFDSIQCDVVKTIFRLILRTVCYGVLFCSSPGFLTGACVASLIAMDMSSVTGISACTKDLLAALLEGDMSSVAESLSTLAYENSPDRSELVASAMREYHRIRSKQGIDDFNKTSMAGKNVEWWLNKIIAFWKWISSYFNPSEADKSLSFLEKYEDHILQILATTDQVCIDSRDSMVPRAEAFQVKVNDIIKKVQAINVIAGSAHHFSLVNATGRILSKLNNIPKPPVTSGSVLRLEPIGIWISGSPGCGKSSLSYSLMSAIAELLGKEGIDANTIYPHATGSAYYDAYDGQFFHLIDDMGQNREEEDMALLCQCISTTPFNVPMAELNDKGGAYRSQIVVATTNRTDFVTTKLTTTGALDRRFPFKMWVKTNDSFKTAQNTLDMKKASDSGALQSGHCWTMSRESWSGVQEVVDISRLAKEVVDQYKARVSTLNQVNTQLSCFTTTGSYVTVNPPTIGEAKSRIKQTPTNCVSLDEACKIIEHDDSFDCFESLKEEQIELTTPSAKLKEWFKRTTKKVAEWFKKHSSAMYAFATMAGIVCAVGSAYTAWCLLSTAGTVGFATATLDTISSRLPKTEPDIGPQRPYNPMSGVRPKKVDKPDELKVRSPQGFNPLEYMHLQKSCIVCTTNHGCDVYGLALQDNVFLIYKHLFDNYSLVNLTWNGLKHTLSPDAVKFTSFEAEGLIDLIRVEVEDLPFRFPNIRKHVAKAVSGDGILLYGGTTRFSFPVKDVRLVPGYILEGESKPCVDGLEYVGGTVNGMCGGALIQKINGAWKFVGMHHAGDDIMYGNSVPLQHVYQGLVDTRVATTDVVYQPSRTKLRRSAMHGLWEVKCEPAALHHKDPRLEISVDNLTKFCSEKYRVNVFKPPADALDAAVLYTKRTLYEAIGVHSPCSIAEALSGCGGNPLEMKTSPGFKYASKGFSKKDLITPEYTLNEPLASDVDGALLALNSGLVPSATFTAYLKDELRPIEKVASGKTRCIEACDLDYTILYRTQTARLYSAIYGTPACATGVAVGINPYTDFHGLAHVFEKDLMFAVDFTKFDGSLSEELMRVAVECLSVCSTEPERFIALHEPVIKSTHRVFDEIWSVRGGMPSGSPCTSVLNSICNLIVCRTIYVALGGRLDELPIVTYGDDVLASNHACVDMSEFCQLAEEFFGMQATSAKKNSTDVSVSFSEATFLKRSFGYIPGTSMLTGVLDLDSMKQHIMWCHGKDTFSQQMQSFLFELVLHGPEIYDEVTGQMKERARRAKVYLPSFEEQIKLFYRSVFV
ncbi:polyprotein [Eel picornavirus Eel/14980]|nr:polyprotein [Eel picornavirus Eel/14980]